jgi:hypothetical protein
MKNLIQTNSINEYRDRSKGVIRRHGYVGDDENGVFHIPSPIDRAPMTIIASIGAGWEHVSVSRKNRCPNWIEMDWVKRQFFHDDEIVMQLHVASKDHISDHPNCLHMWRPVSAQIPTPPFWMVGGCSTAEAEQMFLEHEARAAK